MPRTASVTLAIAILAISPLSSRAEKYPRVISGSITDTSDQPIAGARVEYGYFTATENERQTVLTDADGSYRLDVHEAGRDYRIGVSAQGYAPHYQDRFLPGPVAQPTEFSAKLAPVPSIRFQLVTGDGTPATGITVRAKTPQYGRTYTSFSSPVSPSALPGHDRDVPTDENGLVTLSNLPALPANAYEKNKERTTNTRYTPMAWITLGVKSGDRSYDLGVTLDKVSESEPDEPIKLVVSSSMTDKETRDGFVRGRVLDKQTREAITKFTVVRRYSTDAEELTSTDGRFLTGGSLRRGRKYQMRIFVEGYAVCVGKPVADEKEKAVEFVFELERHPSFRGRLVDAERKPVPDVEILSGHVGENSYAYVEWSALDSYADGHHSLNNVVRVTTDKDGYFVVPEATNQPAVLIVSAKGFARAIIPPSQRPAAGANGITSIRLQEGASIIAIADRTTPLGKLADSVAIGFQSEDRFSHMYHSTEFEGNGQKMYDSLAPGTYNVSLYSQNGATSYPCYTQQVTLGEGETLPVELGKMSGVITLAGQAAPFSTIRINATGEVRGPRYFAVHADIDGEFELTGLEPGPYSLQVDNSSASSGYHGGGRSRKVDIQEDMQIDLRTR